MLYVISMRDILAIVITERRTLLRGLMVSFLLVLPFTFLPALIKNGWTTDTIYNRFPESTFYAFGFSFIVVVASVVHNYNNLVDRKRLLDQPAFTKLDFYGRLDGAGSIANELETFLLGRFSRYYFRLNIIDPDLKKIKIEIIPLIDLVDNKSLKDRLKKEYSFTQNIFFGQTIKVTANELKDENFLLERLANLEKALTDLGAIPLTIDESKLDD